MSEPFSRQMLSVEDYLVAEETSKQKHEYVGGDFYAMPGATSAHNLVASNALITIGLQLRDKPFLAFGSDTKLRIVDDSNETRFYYPDAFVVNRPGSEQESFQDDPCIICEVTSESTRRIDEVEKRNAYLAVPSLAAYIILETGAVAATCYHHNEDSWRRNDYGG
ncbi:MAG: Uma2 family endonuclease, partial [Pirellulaceae bacterium]|nr:Uma2 family endonuclease [Pirellulaceae bacterium]